MSKLTTNQKQSIVHAVNSHVDSQLSMMRQKLMGTPNLNSKHSCMYSEYGWTNNPTFNDFNTAYNTIAAAYGIVNVINSGSFQTIPECIEGEVEGKDETRTEWEKSVDKFTKTWWLKIKEADRLNLIGSYSAIILIARDGVDNLSEELGTIDSIDSIVEMIPVTEEQLKPSDWYSQLTDGLNYGKPKLYSFNEYSQGQKESKPNRVVSIHPSRVIVLNEGAIGNNFAGDSVLRPIYNNILDIQKILGANAEGFFKNAARHIAMSFDKDIDVSKVMQGLGIDPSNKEAGKLLRETMNERLSGLSKGFDAATYGQGVTSTILSVNMTDPEKPINVQMNMIALAMRRSIKGLMGTQTGERASSEDRINDNNRDMERQENFVSGVLTTLVNRLIQYGALEKRDFSWKWEDINSSSDADKVKLFLDMATAAEKAARATGQMIVYPNEMRAVADLPKLDEFEVKEETPPVSDTEADNFDE